jgi:hypothetical protein
MGYNRDMKRAEEESGAGRAGQAMLITVLALGGAILGATTVAGLLTLYQIRATTDAQSSAKAVFAADAGVEWARFSYYCDSIDTPARCSHGFSASVPTLGGSLATVSSTCYSDYNATTQVSCTNTTTVAAISTGMYLSSARAFYLGFSYADPITVYP